MKNRKIQVHLFGALGERTTEVSTRGGFPTRHIKAQRETVPSRKSAGASHRDDHDRTTPVSDHNHRDGVLPPTFKPVSETQTDEKHATSVLDILKQMHPSVDGWLILDEIVLVATAQFGMNTNHDKLRDALRPLYREGQVEHQKNRFGQDCFRLATQKPNLKVLIAEVNAIMSGGGGEL